VEHILEKLIKEDICKNNGCKFALNGRFNPIIVPLPEEIKIIIVSRDPTVDILPLYNYAQLHNCIFDYLKVNTLIKREILFVGAVISTFVYRLNCVKLDKNGEYFENLIKKAYWTHYHKCPTGKLNCSNLSFDGKCAELYLVEEIEEVVNKQTQMIIAFGKDVGSFLLTNFAKFQNQSLKKLEDMIQNSPQIISIGDKYHVDLWVIPHPSGQANKYWPGKNYCVRGNADKVGKQENTPKNIKELLKKKISELIEKIIEI